MHFTLYQHTGKSSRWFNQGTGKTEIRSLQKFFWFEIYQQMIITIHFFQNFVRNLISILNSDSIKRGSIHVRKQKHDIS